MSKYVVIETRDPFDSADVPATYSLCESLSSNGDTVTLYLAQNGVLPLRKTADTANRMTELAGRVRLWADDFSLRERGIGEDELAPGVTQASIGSLVDLIVDDGRKVIWN